MDLFNWLDNSKIVKDFNVTDIRKSDTAYYLNLTISFTDNSQLFIRDYLDLNHRKYSFHWQDIDGNLKMR